MKEKYGITGMTCSACSSHVEKAVSKLQGVEMVSVNLLTESMDVVYAETALSAKDIMEAVEKAGYGAFLMRNGTNAQKKANDVLRHKSAEEDRTMRWRMRISVCFLLPLMYVAMYHMYNDWFGLPIPKLVHLYLHGNRNAMTFALTQFMLVLPILYVNRKFFAVGFKTLFYLNPNMDSLIALGASAAFGYGVFAMYCISYGLGHDNMELVERYSHDLYFDSAGMILTLITLGKHLEGRSKGKTGEAIRKLMDLSPQMAIMVDGEGREQEVPTETLQVGDIFLVKPGSLVPVDGIIIEGASSMDEAAVTGESMPVEKSVGDKVISATVNKAGFLKCRADRVGEDTTLSQIIKLVEEASASKAPIAQLADRVAGFFVPVVVGIAFVTLVLWLLAGAGAEFAISTAIAVLVISCPCALGLATPVAIMVGTGVGASNGILIKSGTGLQQARNVDTVVLDKTGTITAGKLKVMEVSVCVPDMSVHTFISIVAALEKKSEHPLGEAVVEYAEKLQLPLPPIREFQATFGKGVEGVLDVDIEPTLFMPMGEGAVAVIAKSDAAEDVLNRRDVGAKAGTGYFVGNKAFLEDKGVAIDAIFVEGIDRLAEEGMTPLLVAKQDRFLGVIGVVDEIKSTSETAIQKWKELGIHVVMLTGDNQRTAEAVRKQLKIEEVVAEVLPQDKEKEVRRLQQAGHKVAMIGDGVNDAPALAAADVGMAIGAGADVAMESADIVLMKSDLSDAVTAIRLSRAVIRNIKQNLFWAFFYNVVGIPLAAGMWYPVFGVKLTPMFGAMAMSLSSIFLVANALRLRGFKCNFESVECNKRANRSVGDGMPDAETVKNIRCCDNGNGIVEEKYMTLVMKIEGMMCGHCTGRVQKALEAVEGVTAVTMNLEDQNAIVEASSEVTNEELTKAVIEAGYEVKSIVIQ